MTTNNPEEPPLYLSIGTEVSAKFKGAFCEAKIKRIDKLVKCNLKLKHNNEVLTVLDTAVRSSNGNFLSQNEFKPGSIVYVSKQNPSDSTTPTILPENLNAATLNKLLDQSVYTVVFNDGDEKTMKRSFIRFKGEKHFLDSETLNNAPLNNPEHFLYPIKGGIPGSGNELKAQNLTDNDSDAESLSTIKKSLSNRRESNFSSITEDVTVKSEVIEPENDDGNESDASNCSSSSDDISAEEKDRFVAQLFKFMDDRATPMNKVPAINKVDLDLHKFFITVKTFGGYNRVSKQRSWLEVYKKLGLPNVNSSNVINLKSAYKRYLHAFEDFYRKLGSAAGMCDLRTSSSANTSKRSTNADSHHRQLFKSRYLTPTATTSTTQKKNLPLSTPASSKGKAKKLKTDETSSEVTIATTVSSHKPPLTSDSVSTPAQPKRTPSMDDLSLNNELTIESIANSNLFSSSIVSSGGSIIEDHQQQSEELTLFSIAKTFTEDSKKAKKQEKEKKEKKQQHLASNESGAQKRSNATSSSSQQTSTGGKQKRLITGKTNEDDDSFEDDDEEPKEKKKKTNRLSLSDDTASSSKRKNSLKSQNLSDSDNEKDTNSLDGTTTTSGRSTNGGNESSIHDVNTDMETNEKKSKININIKSLDVNDQVKVKYSTSIYPAKIMQINLDNNTVLVHYDGWNKRYDEWIKLDRIVSVIADKNKKNKTNSSSSKTSTASTTTNTSITSKNEKQLNSNVSSPSNSNKNYSSNEKKPVKITDSIKDTNDETAEENLKSSNNQLTSQIVKKRSSTTSSSSSLTSNSNIALSHEPSSSKELNESTASSSSSGKGLNSKKTETIPLDETPITVEKLTTAKLTLKTRNSDSISSNCSTYSIKRSSIDDQTLIANDKISKTDETKIETMSNETKIECMNGLLSIKEEIMDFEPSTTNIIIPTSVIECSSNTHTRDSDETKKEGNKEDECELVTLKTATATTPKSSKVTLKRNSAKNSIKKEETLVPATSVTAITNDEAVSKNETACNKSSYKKSNEEKQLEQTFDEKKIETNSRSNEKTTETLNKHDGQSNNNETKKLEENSKKAVDISSLDQENLNLPMKKTSESKVLAELTNDTNANIQTNINDENVLSISKKTENLPVNAMPESKYSFNLIGVNLTGKQKIRYIEEQMKLCREAYAKLKSEIAVIDRKKKKLKRSLCEKSTTNAVASASANGNNNAEEI